MGEQKKSISWSLDEVSKEVSNDLENLCYDAFEINRWHTEKWKSISRLTMPGLLQSYYGDLEMACYPRLEASPGCVKESRKSPRSALNMSCFGCISA